MPDEQIRLMDLDFLSRKYLENTKNIEISKQTKNNLLKSLQMLMF